MTSYFAMTSFNREGHGFYNHRLTQESRPIIRYVIDENRSSYKIIRTSKDTTSATAFSLFVLKMMVRFRLVGGFSAVALPPHT